MAADHTQTDRELLPCPFCGGKAKISRESLDERYGYADKVKVQCTACGVAVSAVGDTSKPGYADNSTVEKRATDAWNRRSIPQGEEPAKERIGETGSNMQKVHIAAAQGDDLQPLPALPTLPRWLLDIIGEYGMARTDNASPIEVQHRWEVLIGGIKRYAREYGAACWAGEKADARDAARLDFMMSEECYLDTMLADGATPFYRIYWPHLGEAQQEWFKCPRTAIDAALSAHTGGKEGTST